MYFDSDVPRDGDTSAPRSAHARRPELAQQYGDGWRVPPSATRVESALLRDLPADQQNWIRERFAAHPLNTWLQPIRLIGAADGIPTTYVRCLVEYDPTDEDTQRQDARVRGQPSWQYVEMNATHAAPFAQPKEKAQVLLQTM